MAGSIDPIFIAEAVKCYTDSLFKKQVPNSEQLANMKIPEGYVRSNPYFWYRPWTKAASPATPCPSLIDKDPVIKMAWTQQPAPFTKAGHTPKDSLLGYRLLPSNDTISTDKGEGMNLHLACRALQPDWAQVDLANPGVGDFQFVWTTARWSLRWTLCRTGPGGPLVRGLPWCTCCRDTGGTTRTGSTSTSTPGPVD